MMSSPRWGLCISLVAVLPGAWGATALPHYYAHGVVTDKYGVIAPWYKRQNGQFDFRVRIAAETLKRYPWSKPGQGPSPAPEFVYDGTWDVDEEGNITAVPESDWANGDLVQRASYILASMIDYYRYAGDPVAFTVIRATADYLVGYCQTGKDHGWPGMLISVPTMGQRYGQCVLGSSEELKDGKGKIQLDIAAEFASELLHAYEMVGEVRWYDAAKHWGDLLAANRRRDSGAPPWGRYANKGGDSGMNGAQTGGVVYVLTFLDELLRTGYAGQNNAIREARDAGRKYLRDTLLSAWTVDDTFGRNYWDWEQPTQGQNVTEFAAHYLLDHKEVFPNWKNDVRNFLGLMLHHTGASPRSLGDVYHGAWAYPESSNCCDRSLWYDPLELSVAIARYGVEADSRWAREIARRSMILATYDPLSNGQTMDLIDGGSLVNRTWFKIAHPMALKHIIRTMGWLPEIMGPNRENHLMRSSAVVRRIQYGKGDIRYSTFDAPPPAIDVLRLAYAPEEIVAAGRDLSRREDLAANGYVVRTLPGGDFLVTIRHDGATDVSLKGRDPQVRVSAMLSQDRSGSLTLPFEGNQVRVIGAVGRHAGIADVFLDDVKQLVPIDAYSPVELEGQVLYTRSGLRNGRHTLRVVARGTHNPLSDGAEVPVTAVLYSAATGDSGFGEGGGPTGVQRMIFGYAGRTDYRDIEGNLWRPATEFVARTGFETDSLAKTWWTYRQAVFIQNAKDPELYRYGAHWKDLIVNITVAPGSYYARLKLAETQYAAKHHRRMSIDINGRRAADDLDIFAEAKGANRALDLVYREIQPVNGVIEIRLRGAGPNDEAVIQALEIGPQHAQ